MNLAADGRPPEPSPGFSNAQYATIAAATTALTRGGDLGALLSLALAKLLERVGETSGSIWRNYASKRSELVAEMIDGAVVPLARSAHPRATRDLTIGDNPAANAVHRLYFDERLPVVIDDISTADSYENDPGARAYLLRLGIRSQLIVPIVSDDAVIGTISVRSRMSRSWSDEELAAATALAAEAALAMEVDRLAAEARAATAAQERARVAHGLHATFGQHFSAALSLMQGAEYAADAAEANTMRDQATELMRTGLRLVQSTSREIIPPVEPLPDEDEDAPVPLSYREDRLIREIARMQAEFDDLRQGRSEQAR